MSAEMEMPTLCSCGVWFDLNEGAGNHDNTRQICEECANQNYQRKQIVEDIECRKTEIENLKEEIDNIKYLISNDEDILESLPPFK
ncbi:MAG: hypothetical protein WA775_02940 [Psychroserpens sp.]|uniref:hypothetical protein n=1 Tax=Psychroserpens sp. TaxID=2020870 RepID=UPI003CA0CE8A